MVTPQITGRYIAFLDALKIPRHASPDIHLFLISSFLLRSFPFPPSDLSLVFLPTMGGSVTVKSEVSLLESSPSTVEKPEGVCSNMDEHHLVQPNMNDSSTNKYVANNYFVLLSLDKHTLSFHKVLSFLFFLQFFVFLKLPFYDLGQFFFLFV